MISVFMSGSDCLYENLLNSNRFREYFANYENKPHHIFDYTSLG